MLLFGTFVSASHK